MTIPNSSIPIAGSQANNGPETGPTSPDSKPHSAHVVGAPPSGGDIGPQWALCVSTCRALGHNAGIFVRQLGHWLVEVDTGGTIQDGRRWIWRTHEEWAEEFGWWNAQAIKRTIIPSIPDGVLLTERIRDKGLLYSLDFPKIAELIEAAGEPMPRWLIDAIYDPPLATGRQTRFPDDPPVGSEHEPESSLNTGELLIQVNSDLNEKVKSDLYPLYKDNNRANGTETKLARSGNVPQGNNPWAKVMDEDPAPPTFFESLWTTYCQRYDLAQEVAPLDPPWIPLHDRIIEWQTNHQAFIDQSRAAQVFDLITTTNPREPIGLIYTIFRDQMSVHNDLDTPYVPPVRLAQSQDRSMF